MTNAGNRERARSYVFGLCLWLCGWLLAAGFATWHAFAVDRYLDRVSMTRFTDEPLATPLQRVPQAIAPDGQMWVRHAIALAETGAWRLRSTDVDNAPEGRAVYWNSGWALWLEACGRLRASFTKQPLPTAIEEASAWANLPLFLGLMTLASVWAWRRWGGAAGAVMSLGLAGHRGFYGGFYPAYADHHGLISAAVLGVVLGALMAGAGWRRRGETDKGFSLLPKSEQEVMRAVTVSAVCGALGLWVSTASLVVTIAITGVAVVIIGLCAKKDEARICVAAAWRRWGRVGAAVSLAFYLLENFPDRLGMRLEANHPLYALAWWGAGEAMSALLSWRHEGRGPGWLLIRLAGGGVPVLVVPFVLWRGGAKVFAPLDPFLTRIHHSIHEFMPWWVELERKGWAAYRDQVWVAIAGLVLAAVWMVRSRSADERKVAGAALIVMLASLALGVAQNRWLLTASAPQIALAVIAVAALTSRAGGARAAVAALGLGLALFAPGPLTLAKERLHVERVRDVQLGETMQLLYRDIAGALRKAGADQRSVVLTDPNASVGVGYYGRLPTVGTLYWENRDGLFAAAEILAAHDDAEAAARIYARGIKYVVLVSSYDFLAEYNYALGGGAGPRIDQDALGYRLLYGHRVPVWLRPLNYRVPAPLAPLGFKVALFAVDFETPAAVAHERIGRYQLVQGERGLAEASFMASMTADPLRPGPWLRLGELALAAGRLPEAMNFIRAGIERAPASEQERLAQGAAGLFRRQGAEGAQQAETLLGWFAK